ncbi:uncharacterized protein [Anabrus simplex]|uniref:uncharacterized protein n=1 Tax=Anabrus simplex TaxID=316456 RepID=UPI0035A381A6
MERSGQPAFFLVLVLMSCVDVLWAGRMVPDFLTACYKDSAGLLKERGLPLNMITLLELIQKVEMNPRAALDMRTMAFTLLHKLRVDGIERDPYVSETEYVIPYSQKGSQYTKYSVLLGKLLAGHDKFFPENSLNEVEMCALHMMLSSSVDPWQRGDEDTSCPYSLNSRSLRQLNIESCCPVEGGVIHTQWGTVSIGHVIGAIAAALEPQQVRVGRLVELPNSQRYTKDVHTQDPLQTDGYLKQYSGFLGYLHHHKEEDRFSPEIFEAVQRDYYDRLQELPDSEAVTNTWAATLSGDLSEVAVYQGPYLTFELGLNGYWNDTTVPRAFYLKESGPWDMTAAEINGGLDGLILASKVTQWTKVLSRLRLSQVLDMYYSNRGISFDNSYSACMRGNKARQLVDPERLLNETINFARVLYYNARESVQLLDVEGVSKKAAAVFQVQLDKILCSASCTNNSTLPPKIILHVILDATWWGYEAVRLLGALAEGVYVSHHGSSMGILAGRGYATGWLVNTTNSYSNFIQGLNNITKWPTDLDLPLSLSTLLGTLAMETKENLREGMVGGPSHVVLVLGYSATISDTDRKRTQQMVQLIRKQQRDVHFLYVASSRNVNHYQSLVQSDTYNMDSVIVLDNSYHDTVVNMALEKLQQVPWYVIGRLCDDSNATAVIGEMEDYVTPGQQSMYRIHPDYLQGVKKVTLKFRGSGYGILSVCWNRELPVVSRPDSCIEVSGHEESLVNMDNPCGGAGPCRPLYLSVNVTTSYNKCTEDDCRFPDQVRFSFRQEGLRCLMADGSLKDFSASATPVVVSMSLTIMMLLLSLATFV